MRRPRVSPQLYDGTEDAECFRLAGKADCHAAIATSGWAINSLPLHERDFRDLENAMILQLRVLFMRLHNVAIDHRLSCGLAEYDADDCTPFRKAARLVRWTYQRLVRRDLLRVCSTKRCWRVCRRMGRPSSGRTARSSSRSSSPPRHSALDTALCAAAIR
jgi:hypothetical protein